MIRGRKIIALTLIALLLGGTAVLVSIQTGWNPVRRFRSAPLAAEAIDYQGNSYDILKVDPAKQELRLYWKSDDGEPYRDFETLRLALEKEGRTLRFATNAGIFSEDLTPGGLHIENGHVLKNLNLRDGGGNFHMKPNGVFVLGAEGASVLESEEFSQSGQQPLLATQSGPLLVLDGRIHPDFRQGSPNRFIRNGVGVDGDGMIWFAISNQRVNFYDFSHLFLDRLGCQDALYLDGSISEFYLPELDRTSTAGNFCGILALVE